MTIAKALIANGRIIKFDFNINLQLVGWLKPRPCAAIQLNLNGFGDDHIFAPCWQNFKTGIIQRVQNRLAAAIQNRRFRSVNFDDGIIKPDTGKGGHQMFDGFKCDAFAIHDACA